MKVPYGYLPRQFSDPGPILEKVGQLVSSGALTLGAEVETFEKQFAEFIGVKHAIGVGSGTDALFLSLKALGIGPGDEVITAVNTFVATAGAIETSGATLRFVDCNERYVMDHNKLEEAISQKTKAIVPVHYSGQPVDMQQIQRLADKHNLAIVEDACTAIDAEFNGKRCGSWGTLAGFSLHPIKNLHVWGDGGVITTKSDELAKKLRLMRNHGMRDRDHYAFYAYNSRLDTLQAAVGNMLIGDVKAHTEKRIEHARFYDESLAEFEPHIILPPRWEYERHVYHMYMIQCDTRDELLKHLKSNGVSAKIHYPIPLHLQEASKKLGYQKGDFPKAEAQAEHLLSLPAHPYLTHEERQYVVDTISSFFV